MGVLSENMRQTSRKTKNKASLYGGEANEKTRKALTLKHTFLR